MMAVIDRGSDSWAAPAPGAGPTMHSMCVGGLTRLADALDIGVRRATLREIAKDGLGRIAGQGLGERPGWSSGLSDDGTPFEWSIAFGGSAPELRVLVEPQHAPASLERNWDAGLAANERYATHWGASLERFACIRDLFEPRSPSAMLAIWHAISLTPDRRPLIKVYVDAAAAGADHASPVVREALTRLGMDANWQRIQGLLARLPGSRLLFISLDLASAPDARVKVYAAHPHASAAELDNAMVETGGCHAGEILELCTTMTGGTGPYPHRPLQSCLGFTSSHVQAPVQATVHVPVRSYVRDDAVALERLVRYLGDDLGDAARRAVGAIARRPLDVGRGLIAYVSLRSAPQGRRVMTYLSAEAYAIKAPRLDLGRC